MIEQIDLRQHRGEPEVRAEEIIKRRDHLKGLGFPQDFLDNLAQIRPTFYDPRVVNEHIDWLSDHNFQDPVKLISSSPAIFGYNQESMQGKLDWLTSHGFQDPVKLISSLPAIFGYSIRNIDRRLRLFNRLINLYNLPFELAALMDKEPYLFSTKPDKIFVLARILRDYRVNPPELNEQLISKLLRSNLEDVLVALNESVPEGETIDNLLKRIPQVWRRKLSKEEKRRIIKEGLQEEDKIKKRYFRGYTDKLKGEENG